MTLLQVRDLKTHFFTDDGVVKAVDGVSFFLNKGETLGLVGESGSGKSVMSLSLMRLVQSPPGRIVGGSILYTPDGGEPEDLVQVTEKRMREVRGAHIAMVFQEPMTSLNPVLTIGDQIGEALELHDKFSKKDVRTRVAQMLKLVSIPSPERRAREYPHQLSGGMRQRAVIAMALSCKPSILIADEPTTALDVTIQAQILDLILRLQKEFGMAMLLVTHDLGVVAETADRVAVMYAGKIVESGAVDEIFSSPLHPYTKGLLRSIPPLEKLEKGTKLPTIPGTVPNLARLPPGCAFAARCPIAKDRCLVEAVPDDPCGVGRLVRCFYVTA